VCEDGVADCPIEGETSCGDTCVDLQSDPAHCGSCSNDCSALPPPYGYERDCYLGQCGFVTGVNGSNNGQLILQSCQQHCTFHNGTCGTLDWALYDASYPCGASTGCFYYPNQLNYPMCVTELACGTVPTKNQSCGGSYASFSHRCFCN
jgi:hypothetical protein